MPERLDAFNLSLKLLLALSQPLLEISESTIQHQLSIVEFGSLNVMKLH